MTACLIARLFWSKSIVLEQLDIFDFGLGSNLILDSDYGSLTKSVSELDNDSITNPVSEPKTQALQRFLKRGIHIGKPCINKYSPGKKQLSYYRFSYRVCNRVKHKHIPGGNCDSRLAIDRVQQIQNLIDRGVNIGEILALIEGFSK